jgi:hypothetical protein
MYAWDGTIHKRTPVINGSSEVVAIRNEAVACGIRSNKLPCRLKSKVPLDFLFIAILLLSQIVPSPSKCNEYHARNGN